MRLQAEITQMQRHRANLQLYQDDETGELLWQGSLRGHGIQLIYSPFHPYEKITVKIFPQLPCVNLHVHPDGSICYIKENEWGPEWTAYAVFLTTIRFLNDFYSGRMK